MADGPQTTPDGWPDEAGQFDVRDVTEDDLARWEEVARFWAWNLPAGRFNWPGAMRSLIAKVRKSTAEVEDAYDRGHEAGTYAGMGENG
jgi:hypothetical protein